MNDLDQAILERDDQTRIPALGEFMGIARYGYGSMDPEQKMIFEKAQTALLAIPGHAKYYQDQIERTRTFAKYYEALSKEEKRKIEDQFREQQRVLGEEADYDGVRRDAFDILGLLPSPETVAVLGHYLEDPEGRDGKTLLGDPIFIPGADAGPPAPNCGKAYFALGRLGIEHPPIPPTDSEDVLLNQERTDAWKQWWQEIKAGKRTYRLKGSPIEYGADGPATPEQIEKACATRERDEKRAAGHPKGTDKEAVAEKEPGTKMRSRPLFMLIGAAVAVLLSLVWYVRRKRMSA